MNYFEIQPIKITINNPFDYKTIKAIKWTAINVPRGSNEPSVFNCILIDQDDVEVYNWQMNVSKTVVDQWLDDYIIDDYICSTDSRFVKV